MIDRWATFDCYGTLIDWERGIRDAFTGLWPHADSNELLAAFHRIEPQEQTGTGKPYENVLADVLAGVATEFGLGLPDDQRDALSASLPEWPPFAEVPDSLHELRERGWKLAILSNCDPDLLDASVRRLGTDIDVRVTVADSRSYKPAHGHWDTFFSSTDADPAGHVHVAASLFHDVAPCNEMGLRVVWINRLDEATDLATTAELTDLRPLADTLDEMVQA